MFLGSTAGLVGGVIAAARLAAREIADRPCIDPTTTAKMLVETSPIVSEPWEGAAAGIALVVLISLAEAALRRRARHGPDG